MCVSHTHMCVYTHKCMCAYYARSNFWFIELSSLPFAAGYVGLAFSPQSRVLSLLLLFWIFKFALYLQQFQKSKGSEMLVSRQQRFFPQYDLWVPVSCIVIVNKPSLLTVFFFCFHSCSPLHNNQSCVIQQIKLIKNITFTK